MCICTTYNGPLVVYREQNETPITLGLRIGDTVETHHDDILLYTASGGQTCAAVGSVEKKNYG